MDLRIPDEALRKVMARADRGDDPFALTSVETDRWQRCRAKLEDALDGMELGLAREVARDLEAMIRDADVDERTTGMDTVVADILCSVGIDPLACAWLAKTCGSVTLRAGEPGDIGFLMTIDATSKPGAPAGGTNVRLARGVTWDNGTLYLEELPETLASGVPGLPLSAVVAHPVLDRLGATILEARASNDGMTGLLRTDADAEEATVAGMLEANPCGSR